MAFCCSSQGSWDSGVYSDAILMAPTLDNKLRILNSEPGVLRPASENHSGGFPKSQGPGPTPEIPLQKGAGQLSQLVLVGTQAEVSVASVTITN